LLKNYKFLKKSKLNKYQVAHLVSAKMSIGPDFIWQKLTTLTRQLVEFGV
jgi:hypothetical protein